MKKKQKQPGNIGDLLSTGLCILAMTVMMLAYMECTELIHQKSMAGQLARKYILRMETIGYLTEPDESALREELREIGVTDTSLAGTTLQQVGYGAPVTLCIKGKLGGRYTFEEKRVSTAKN
ncbi:MAG: hypothetical protein NC081_04250 [Roseburia sp.]|nr:hypothetical protein [Roseburia sp.]